MGVLEELDQRVRELMAESEDLEYTQYLKKMTERIFQQKYQADLLKAEVDKTYEMYLRRMGLVGRDAKEFTEATEQAVYANTQYFNGVEELSQKEMPVQLAPQKKRNAEFAIGGAVLSIVGGGFILAALVMLGMTFMAGIFKGICLYALSLVFLLVSELFLYRKWPMMGATFSAIGIGGLYLSTAVNYLGLHNFNLWVTLAITLVITLFVILLSRKRDSVLYRVIGMIAGYLCFFTIRAGITDTEFIVVSGLVLLMNVLCILLPVKKAKTGILITHVSLNTFFAICFVIRVVFSCNLADTSVLIFVIGSIIVMQMLLVAQFFHYKESGNTADCTGFLTVYYISMVCHLSMTRLLTYNLVDIHLIRWYAYGVAIILGVIGLVSIFVLILNKCSGLGHVYTFLNLAAFWLVGCAGGQWNDVVCLVVLLVLAKLICLKKDELVYRINDIVLTLWLCMAVAWYEDLQVYLLLVGVVFSVLMIKYWQTFYEILLTLVLVVYTAEHLPMILQLPAVVGMLLVGIFIFNYVKRWQGKYILVYNILALIGQAICFLKLSNPIYHNEYITFLCMLVFGLATLVLTLQEKYRMNCKGKYLVLAGFLTYMAFIFRTGIPVVNSILLMVIALVCVGIGFAVEQKKVRIYGLVLSLFVCGKLVLYDFFGAATAQKTILFFVVGVIALIIAAIYIILEKKNNT